MSFLKIPWRAYWQLLRRYLRPQSGAAFFMSALLLASIALQLVGPQVVRAFIDAARAGAGERDLIAKALIFIGVAALQQVMNVLAAYWGARVAWTATNALRADLTEHLVKLDLGFHKARTPGELIERVDGDVNALAEFFSSFVVQLVGSALLLAGVLAIVFREDVRLGLVLSGFTLLAVAVLGWVRRFATPLWAEDRQRSAAYYGYLGEAITAAEDLRSSGAVPYAMRRLFEHLRGWMPVRRRAEARRSVVWMAAVAVFACGDAIAYGLGGGLYRIKAISLGTVYMIVAYVALLAEPIETIRTQMQNLQRADASIGRVRELMEARSSLEDGTESLPSGALPVEFRTVSFGYDDGPPESPQASPGGPQEPRVHGSHGSYDSRESRESQEPQEPQEPYELENLSFTLEPGCTLGLLGRTGSGKTTIARLLFRMYDPQQGEIRLGGVNLRHARIESIRTRVGLVTQDVQILEASLRDNITFFDPDIPDGRVIAAIEALGLKSWFDRLPGGLDTPVSQAGLSAGEAQCVALTRVFMRDPGLIILDEASSRLDPATEALLERALDKLLLGRTAIIIAHRLSTVERADDILIIRERGWVLEHGSREKLAADANSTFCRLQRAGMEAMLG